MDDNLKVWQSFNQPPKTALKEIQAGRMKGKSDINPQWRYKAMTDTFGIVGIGWKFSIDKMWTEQAANNETMCFVNVSVFVKQGGEWSEAIPGTGGATLIVSEKSGMYNDDDAYKKATTDALSTAMKMLGVAADIYMGLWDGAKYKEPQATTQPTEAERKAKGMATFAELKKRADAAGVTIEAMSASLSADAMIEHYKTQLQFVKAAEAQKAAQ
jgi:hypothetical protein